MSGRGTMRSGKGGTHRPKHPRALSGLDLEQIEGRLVTVREAITNAEDYIVGEVTRLRAEPGNAPEVSKLVKFLYEVRREAHAEAQRLGGAAGATAEVRDFLRGDVGPAGEES